MITDSIANAAQYYGLGKGIEAALENLRSQDFDSMEPGRHDIEGTECHAIVQRYDTRPREQGKWEAHRAYIDIRYVASGTEFIGYPGISSLKQGEFQADKDYLPWRARAIS